MASAAPNFPAYPDNEEVVDGLDDEVGRECYHERSKV